MSRSHFEEDNQEKYNFRRIKEKLEILQAQVKSLISTYSSTPFSQEISRLLSDVKEVIAQGLENSIPPNDKEAFLPFQQFRKAYEKKHDISPLESSFLDSYIYEAYLLQRSDSLFEEYKIFLHEEVQSGANTRRNQEYAASILFELSRASSLLRANNGNLEKIKEELVKTIDKAMRARSNNPKDITDEQYQLAKEQAVDASKKLRALEKKADKKELEKIEKTQAEALNIIHAYEKDPINKEIESLEAQLDNVEIYLFHATNTGNSTRVMDEAREILVTFQTTPEKQVERLEECNKIVQSLHADATRGKKIIKQASAQIAVSEKNLLPAPAKTPAEHLPKLKEKTPSQRTTVSIPVNSQAASTTVISTQQSPSALFPPLERHGTSTSGRSNKVHPSPTTKRR